MRSGKLRLAVSRILMLEGLKRLTEPPGYSSRRTRIGNLSSVVFIDRYSLSEDVAPCSSSPKRKRVVFEGSMDSISCMPLRDLVTGIEYLLRLSNC